MAWLIGDAKVYNDNVLKHVAQFKTKKLFRDLKKREVFLWLPYDQQ